MNGNPAGDGPASDGPVATGDFVDEDRRGSTRQPANRRRDVLAVRVRPGIAASLIDLSPTGAAIDADRRLIPGRWVHIQLLFVHGAVTARGRVVRSHVAWLTAGRLVYRCALQFDRPLCDVAPPEVMRPRRAGDPDS